MLWSYRNNLTVHGHKTYASYIELKVFKILPGELTLQACQLSRRDHLPSRKFSSEPSVTRAPNPIDQSKFTISIATSSIYVVYSYLGCGDSADIVVWREKSNGCWIYFLIEHQLGLSDEVLTVRHIGNIKLVLIGAGERIQIPASDT